MVDKNEILLRADQERNQRDEEYRKVMKEAGTSLGRIMFEDYVHWNLVRGATIEAAIDVANDTCKLAQKDIDTWARQTFMIMVNASWDGMNDAIRQSQTKGS